MASDEEYRLRISGYKSHKALLKLWEQVLGKDTPNWDEGKALEYLILRAFEIEKASVCWPFEVKVDGTLIEQIEQTKGSCTNKGVRTRCLREQAKQRVLTPLIAFQAGPPHVIFDWKRFLKRLFSPRQTDRTKSRLNRRLSSKRNNSVPHL